MNAKQRRNYIRKHGFHIPPPQGLVPLSIFPREYWIGRTVYKPCFQIGGIAYWRELDVPELHRFSDLLPLRMYRYDVGIITQHFNEQESEEDLHFLPDEIKVVFQRGESRLIYSSIWLWTTKI